MFFIWDARLFFWFSLKPTIQDNIPSEQMQLCRHHKADSFCFLIILYLQNISCWRVGCQSNSEVKWKWFLYCAWKTKYYSVPFFFILFHAWQPHFVSLYRQTIEQIIFFLNLLFWITKFYHSERYLIKNLHSTTFICKTSVLLVFKISCKKA